jgi:hypothetical protein
VQQKIQQVTPLKSGILFTEQSVTLSETVAIGTPRLRTQWQVNQIVITFLRAMAGFSKFGNGGEPIVSGNITVSVEAMIDGFVIAREMVSFNVSRKLVLPKAGEQVGESEQLAAPFILNIGDLVIPPGHQLEVKISLVVTNTSKSNFSNGLLGGLFITPKEALEFSGSFPEIAAAQTGIITTYEIIHHASRGG